MRKGGRGRGLGRALPFFLCRSIKRFLFRNLSSGNTLSKASIPVIRDLRLCFPAVHGE